jgi:peroxiredoxin
MSGDSKTRPETERHSPTSRTEAFTLAASLEGPLQQRLDFYSQALQSLSPEISEAYDELALRLSPLKAAGPKAGKTLPDFLLPDADGNLISLASLLEDGPLVLSLNRGHWCPWCRLELRAMRDIYRQVRAEGAQFISIIPETASYSVKLTADNQLPFKVLTDLDLGYSLSLGLMIWVGPKIKSLYSSTGLDLALFQRNEAWMLPIPATFVLSRDGIVIARFVDPDFRKRMEPQDILAALKQAR